MADGTDGGASLAWRLLATLEGGSIVLIASALVAYTARGRMATAIRTQPCTSVAITDTTNELGMEIKRRLEAHGCTVSGVTSGAESGITNKVDALIVVGAQRKTAGLDGLSSLVTEDVYNNIKLLEINSSRVNRGGSIAWACAGAERDDAFADAVAAFDTVIQASLFHITKVFQCMPVWVGRGESVERTAERVVAAILTCGNEPNTTRFSLRNAAHTVGDFLYRWLMKLA